jgi:cytoskeletal protein CcmA (bactofilin family)
VFTRTAGFAVNVSGVLPFAVIGLEGVSLGEAAVVTGDIASNATVAMKLAKVVGDVSCNVLSLREAALVDGDVHCNIVNLGSKARITGIQGPSTPPIVGILPPVQSTPGVTSVIVPKLGARRLPPGNFLSIVTGEAAEIRFVGGQYNVGELRLAKGTRLIFEGESTINVANRLDVGGDVVLAGAGGLPSNAIRVNYGGVADAVFGRQVEGALTLVAPNALIRLGEAGVYSGRIWGKSIQVGKRVQITADN